MKGKPSSSLEENTEEMRTWRGVGHDEMDQCLKNLAERMKEEVLDNYKAEDSNREAYQGRGAPLEWRRVRRSEKCRTRKWCEKIFGQESSLCSESTTCSVGKACTRSQLKEKR